MSVKFYNSIEQAITDIINKIDGDIRLGAPLGLGKPMLLLTPCINGLAVCLSDVCISLVPYP